MRRYSELVSDALDAVSRHPLLQGGTWSPLDLGDEDLLPVVRRLLAPYPPLQKRGLHILIALEEVRGNIVFHADDPRGGVCLVRHASSERPTLDVVFADRGGGFRIDDRLPPYGKEMLDREYEFRQTLDGVVSCRVAGADTVEIMFRRYPEGHRLPDVEHLPVGGLGLSIMSKVMDRVVYLSHIGPANLLWMQLRVRQEETGR